MVEEFSLILPNPVTPLVVAVGDVALGDVAEVDEEVRAPRRLEITELNIPAESAQTFLTGALCPRKC
jgi:hypothetical protein